MRLGLIAALAATLLGWPPVLFAQAAEGPPPISARYEAHRDFGYHVGDLIPLTLVVEAARGGVVDLDRLPRRGGAVGPFEIRDLRIDRSTTVSTSVYRLHFILQAFVPATSAQGLAFPPLELRVALPEDRSPDGGYAYRAVTLPPHPFSLSPTAVGPASLRPPKGAVVPRLGWPFWGAAGAGVLCLAAGSARLAQDLARRRQRRPGGPSKAQQRAFRTLKALRTRYPPHEERTLLPLALGVSAVLRRFLSETTGTPARAQTLPQIRKRLTGHPDGHELVAVLAWCDQITYGGHHPKPSEKDGLVQTVATLIGRLDGNSGPMSGGNGAPG